MDKFSQLLMRRLYCCLLFILGSATSLASQQIFFRRYTPADGLPSSHIYALCQDHSGYVWVCTDKGLARFDGTDFQVFTVRNGLPSNDVWRAQTDRQGRLWLNTFNGITCLENGRVQTIALPEAQRRASFVEHEFLPDGRHIIFLDDVPFFYDEIKRQLSPQPLQSERSKFVQTYLGKPVFISPSYGDLLLDGQKKLPIFPQKFVFNAAHFQRIGGQSWYFALAEKRVLKFVGDSVLNLNFYLKLGKKPLKTFDVGKFNDSNLLFFTDRGCVVADSNFQIQSKYTFLQQFAVRSALEDSFGNCWIVTAEGLCLVPAGVQKSMLWQPFGPSSEAQISAFAASDFGQTIWIGTADGQLCVRHRGKFSMPVVAAPANFPNKQIRSLTAIGGFVFVVGAFGVRIFSEKKLLASLFSSKPKIKEIFENQSIGAVKSINVESIEPPTLLLSSSNSIGRLERLANGRWQIKTLQRGRSYHALPGQGGTWVGKMAGLFWLPDGKDLETCSDKHPAFGKPIANLSTDLAGGLWVCTDGSGLYRLSPEGSVDEAPLPYSVVPTRVVFSASDSSLWVATNGGLFLLKIRNFTPLRCEIQRFTRAHGLFFNDIHCILPLGDEVLVGTELGVVSFFPKKTDWEKLEKPVLAIDEILVMEQPLDFQNQQLRLRHNENQLRLRFHARSYKSAGDVGVEYFLEGLDPNWKTADNAQLDFPNLPPGDFLLRLRARDLNGDFSPETLVHFQILPPWWQTWWARLLGLAVLALGIWAYLTRRIKNIRREEAAKINEARRVAELELRALQAQMNPHFIFNALHSIQEFIFSRDQVAANQYIVKFSRLIRAFLEASRKQRVSLAEEVLLLRHYIELEQLRLEQKFDFEIEIAHNIDPETVRLPAFFVQPFVENAIKHGLTPQNDNGKLSIRFSKDQLGNLLAEVKDNGIGRKKSATLPHAPFDGYRSRGMEIIEERRQIMQAMHQTGVEVQIEDLIPPATGTRVRLLFGMPPDDVATPQSASHSPA